MRFSKITFVAAASILLGTSSIVAADEEGFRLFSDSKLYSQIRPRYEYADTDGGTEAAKAFTVRTVIGGKFADVVDLKGLNADLEATNVTHFGLIDDYRPEHSEYDVIMDPSQTRMTQANLSYKFGDTTFIAGRKMLALDNQRFIGHVGWRQMPQTYDVIAAIDKSVKNLTITGAYVTGVNKIFENHRDKTNSLLLNGSYVVMPELKLTGYGYFLASIHNTFGIRASGKTKFSGAKISYEAEYAFQDKPTLKEGTLGDAKPDHEADYFKFGISANYNSFILGAAYEILGEKEGSGGGAFNTPWATLHGMNGWADKFLGTPPGGLEDLSITLGYVNKQYGRIIAILRDFESNSGGTDLGTEFDVVYAYKVNKNIGLTLKSAFYEEGDSGKGDTTKYWLMLDYKFNI